MIVGEGVIVGSNNCPGLQPDKEKERNIQNIPQANRLALISFFLLHKEYFVAA
jgi:hypothetical protein